MTFNNPHFVHNFFFFKYSNLPPWHFLPSKIFWLWCNCSTLKIKAIFVKYLPENLSNLQNVSFCAYPSKWNVCVSESCNYVLPSLSAHPPTPLPPTLRSTLTTLSSPCLFQDQTSDAAYTGQARHICNIKGCCENGTYYKTILFCLQPPNELVLIII